MTPFVSDPDLTLYVGDCLDVLRSLPEGCVDCCVTSPPYWGLRDYGTGSWDGGDPDHAHETKAARNGRGGSGAPGKQTAGAFPSETAVDECSCGATRVDRQLGLEASPDEYVAAMVAVFGEVRRVLADHGTLWLNLGDSYAANRSYQVSDSKHTAHDFGDSNASSVPDGLKPKDLVGIPWSVAKALQAPRYTGRIERERDRVWLAATIDAEGSICGFTHERADGDGTRTGIHITITNTSMPLLAEAQRIWPTSRADGNGHGPSALGTRECRRWIAHNVDDKAQLLAELYPYLIAKREQALLAWNFLEMSKVSKRIGKLPEGAQAKERRAWIVRALSDLNHGREVDVPSWIVEPPAMYEPGWYLRSDIIWAKPNPMPESVTDRPTKAHEYVFLLSKSPRYWFDQEAVREPHVRLWDEKNIGAGNGWATGEKAGSVLGRETDPHGGLVGALPNPTGRNVRSVWQIATQPYADAHFATFPEELPRRCILAGCPEWVCGTCGKPRERIVERSVTKEGEAYESRMERVGASMEPLHQPNRSMAQVPTRYNLSTSSAETVGWSDCGHANFRPGVVLDPFFGSGTTGLVARKHGRRTIGIELNPDYARMAARRLQQLSLLA